MNKKSISPISLLVVSILLMIFGIFMLFNPSYLENIVISIVHILIIGIGVLSIITYIFNKDKKQIKPILSGILYILLGIFIKNKFIFIEKSLVVIIGVYAFMNFIAQLTSTIILYSNKAKEWIVLAIATFISFAFSMILIFHPFESRSLLSVISGIYLMLYGLTVFKDFISEISYTNKIKDSLKRKIRVRLPIIYTAFIPQKLLENINKTLKTSTNPIFVESKSDDDGELEVFIHLGKNCANGFGHIDICYKDTIYSYGTYDESSDRLFELVSDGVLIESPREQYIEFNSKSRHMVSFVLSLSSNQRNAIEKKIEDLKSNCVQWHCEAESNLDKEYDDYTNTLYKATNANFYKFKSGYFKTYFVLTTNCVKLADTIIGSAGIDAISLNGVITPGIYFNFLNKLFNMNNSIVIRRNMYNMYSNNNCDTKKKRKFDREEL